MKTAFIAILATACLLTSCVLPVEHRLKGKWLLTKLCDSYGTNCFDSEVFTVYVHLELSDDGSYILRESWNGVSEILENGTWSLSGEDVLQFSRKSGSSTCERSFSIEELTMGVLVIKKIQGNSCGHLPGGMAYFKKE